jgi:hypothetical protein
MQASIILSVILWLRVLVGALLPLAVPGLTGLPAGALRAGAMIQAEHNAAQITFPESIRFSVDLSSAADIQQVVLEYGVDQMTCGQLTSKSFPEFQPGQKVSVAWTWEMKQTGSLPPGSKVWWRWNVTDAAGENVVTESQRIPWIDSTHPWQTVTQGDLALHWYEGDAAFGKELLDSAVADLGRYDQDMGLKPDGLIDLYIYKDDQALKEALYYQPDWIGGEAFPENNIVTVGSSDKAWALRTIAHELNHVLVDRLAFSCLGHLPTWLNEGLAQYAEGEPDQGFTKRMKGYIQNDEFLSARALSGEFPSDSKAYMAYDESLSMVDFLLKQYGKEKMLALLGLVREGTAIDSGLQQVYGFDQDGLEAAWRGSIGARAHAVARVQATLAPQSTAVPTIIPIAGAPVAATISPQEAYPTDAAEANVPAKKDLGLLPMLLGIEGCFVVPLVIVLIAVSLLLPRKKKGGAA